MYISWAAYYEGKTDADYFNVLIPRVLEEILRLEGLRPYEVGLAPAFEVGVVSRSFDHAVEEICKRLEEFHILFVHADGGGRAQQNGIASRREALVDLAVDKCNFDRNLGVMLSPVKEIEAWALCDEGAVKSAFGISRIPENIVLPASPRAAESLQDPKALLHEIERAIFPRKKSSGGVLVRIAQEQNLKELRRARSFQEFEDSLRTALRQIGCLAQAA